MAKQSGNQSGEGGSSRNSSGEYITLTLRLLGPRNVRTGRWVSRMEAGVTEGLLAALDTLAEGYKDDIAKEFARRHGRTGETEASFKAVTGVGTRTGWFESRVEVGGHIGYVVNELPPHVIEVSSIP